VTRDLDLLRVDLETSFLLSAPSRLERQNDPDETAGPRLVLLGCDAGNVFAVRDDIDDATFEAIATIVAAAPPWREAGSAPPCLPALLAALQAGLESVSPGVIFLLRNGHPSAGRVQIVGDDAPEGERLLARLHRDGFPPSLVNAGFRSRSDFWPPWVVALEDGEIAATAFAARLGARGVEVGVYTFEAFRGRGLAGAVTAAWSAHPALVGRTLFYSTQWTNLASQRVAAKLGLRRIGQSFRIA
jgi:hypothetical protein